MVVKENSRAANWFNYMPGNKLNRASMPTLAATQMLNVRLSGFDTKQSLCSLPL
jgi:hypothetical protein